MAPIMNDVSNSLRADSIATSFSSASTRSSKLSTESPHPFLVPPDGKGGSAPVNANTQPGRVLPALRRLYRRAKRLHDMVADCWIGDFIGGLCLFFLLFAGLFLGCGLGL